MSHSLKVGLVLDRFDPAAGGLERWTEGFARFLAARGHQPEVLAFEAMAAPPVPVHVLAGHGVIGRARAVEAAVQALAADVVLDTGTGWSGDVFMPCTGSRQWSQRRLVASHSAAMRVRAALSPRSIALDRALGRLERAQVRRARHVIAVSRLVRDLLVQRHGMLPISVVPNGVETGRFAAERMTGLRAGMRAELGVGDSVVFLGSAHNPFLKGMDAAIRALPGGARLVIAGSRGDRRLAGMAATGRVQFLGVVEDMAPLFAAADVLVHPTRWDACSLSTIEAGAAGLPVITSARNGAADLVVEGETGFVLEDPEDVARLAERMRRLLDPGLRRRMGQAARLAAAGHDVATNHLAVLDILMEAARPR